MAEARVALETTASTDAVVPRASGARIKRAGDVTGALLVLLLASPVLLALAALVRCTTPGGVLFRQDRIGRNGTRFRLLKFRTMCAEAEAILARDPDLLAKYVTGGHKIPDAEDPRITPIGRFLRRTGLDELPQLFNVLRGEMSLVGPRPIVPAEIERYPAFVEVMRWTPPGITGPWQLSRSDSADYECRAELDWEYATKRSLGHDILLLVRTFARARR
jgi:lipopolysaccharide/colanic/teichoic acid biosynthesis glycosyltransferase